MTPYVARKALINMGKVIPFFICFIIFIAYTETLFACLLSNYIICDGVLIPNTPLSFNIGHLFEYDYLVVFVAATISLAIEACKWNLVANIYMFSNLLWKSYFDFEISIETIYIIATTNILVCGYIVFKGIKTFTKTSKL